MLDRLNLVGIKAWIVRQLLDHIAQLEAKPSAAAHLADLIRKRYPRMLERGNPVYDGVLDAAIGRIEAGGPIDPSAAVVVPDELIATGWAPHGWSPAVENRLRQEAAAKLIPIPADRVLKDGQVAVDRELWELALELADNDAASFVGVSPMPPDIARYRALRSAQAGNGGGA